MYTIKLINKAAVKALIDNGYVNESNLRGISITSRGKKSSAKKYYAEDSLAFTAWTILGENPEDKDFQKWKENKIRKQRSNYSTD